MRETDPAYRAMFNAVSDGLVVYDPASGAVLEANPAFCRMHGYASMIGLAPSSYVHANDRAALARYLDTVGLAGECRWRAQHLRRDGSIQDAKARTAEALRH